MNRKIKFRVWNHIARGWDQGYGYALHCYVKASQLIFQWNNGYLVSPYCDDRDDYVVQQYTGLQDSRGKDIYEGDFLQWEYPETFEELRTVAVRWGKEGWLTTSALGEYGECEIVGNIFENPELQMTGEI
jgi:hypothetical protein